MINSFTETELCRKWVPPPPVIFHFDPKKPKPEGFAAYTILQMHAAYKAGVQAGLEERKE